MSFHVSGDGICTGFSARGHAGYSAGGNDIVCAAVSALTQGAVISLEKLAGKAVIQEKSDGCLICRIRNPDDQTQLIFAGLELSLLELQKEYGNYIDVCHG